MKFIKKFKKEGTPDVHTRALTRKISVVDVKGYLQKEYERSEGREKYIAELEKTIEDLEKTKLEYEAMLVVQEKTQARTERLDAEIKRLREKLEVEKDTEKSLRSQIVDLRVNSEKKLEGKAKEIKTLKAELRKFKKEIKE